MKNKYISSFIIFAICTGFTACTDKENLNSDPYSRNIVYMKQKTDVNKIIKSKPDGTFITEVKATDRLIPVYCTKPAPNDIQVNFEIDKEYLTKYNEIHKTNYEILPGVSLNSITIPQGKYESKDTLKATIADLKVLAKEDKKYMLPIKISSSSAFTASKKYNHYVITYETAVQLIEVQDKTHVVGKEVTDYTNWTYYLMGQSTEDYGAKFVTSLTDNKEDTYYNGYGSSMFFDVDMGEERNIASYSFKALKNKAPQKIFVQVIEKPGKNSKVIKELGEMNFDTSLITGDFIHVNFANPVKTRYLRVGFAESNHYYGAIVLFEIHFYTAK